MRFKQKKFWRISFYLLAVLVVIFALAISVKKVVRPTPSFIVPPNQPGHTVTTAEPVKADIFFSNEPGVAGAWVTGTDLTKLINEEIDQAQTTLEIAMYSFRAPAVKEAIYRAAQRGVKVTLILDFRKSAVHDKFFNDLPPGIKRLDLGSTGWSTALMHHKFAIIDRGAADEKLIFGSFNWTELQAVYDRSFIFVTDNHELVASFGREFDRLVKGEGERKKLQDADYRPWDLSLKAGGYNYEVWFGPGWKNNNFDQRIISLLAEAQSDIKIMIWDFTDPVLAQEILRRARAGLKITILADNFNFSSSSSVFQLLDQAKAEEHLANLEILNDAALAPSARPSGTTSGEAELDPFLHHHLLIIDNKKILFGTNNWSQGGAYFNDESVLVSDDPKILKRFLTSFSYNYQLIKTAAPR